MSTNVAGNRTIANRAPTSADAGAFGDTWRDVTTGTVWRCISYTGGSTYQWEVSSPAGGAVVYFDDFLGDVVPDQINVTAGSDSPAGAAINIAVDGTLRLTTGDSNTSQAADAVQVALGALNYKASTGGLVIEGRLKVSAIAAVQVYFGFTDQDAALEMPVTVAGGAYTTNASDAAGFLFDTGATAATVKCVGVAADVDAVHVDSGIAFVAATYMTLRLEISAAGVGSYYINGNLVATIAGVVTPATSLVPVIEARSLAANSKTVDLDYLYVSKVRG